MRIELSRASEPSVQGISATSAVTGQPLPHLSSMVRAAQSAMLPLELDQEIEARVVEMLADGRVILDIGGTLLEANDPGSLELGQRLRLRVDLLEPRLLLHIVEQELGLEAAVTKLLRQHLPKGEQPSLSGLKSEIESNDDTLGLVYLEKLRSFLAQLINNKEIMTPARLMQFVRNGGQHYEMKLLRAAAGNASDLAVIAKEDLKGLLLGALDELGAASNLDESRRAIAGQLYDLEGRQAANLLAQIQAAAFSCKFHSLRALVLQTSSLPSNPTAKGTVRRKIRKAIAITFFLHGSGRVRAHTHRRPCQKRLSTSRFLCRSECDPRPAKSRIAKVARVHARVGVP